MKALTDAGIARDRLILDPGMGFFLGTDPETSFAMLRRICRSQAGLRPARPDLGLA